MERVSRLRPHLAKGSLTQWLTRNLSPPIEAVRSVI